MVIYDRLVNLVTKNWLADLVPKEILNKAVSNINTSYHRIIIKVNKNHDKVIWRALATEIDNHDDTHCFGANFWPISFTSEECTVSPLLPEYAKQMNIPKCTCVTSLTLDSLEVVILEFGQGLWFGNGMEKSLINPNQWRKFGIQICDDPTDTHRNLEIKSSEDLFIPMTMAGATFGIVMHPPTDNKLH